MFESPRYKLFLFGSPRLEMDGKPCEFARRKTLALLAYLALRPLEHAREDLAALFWADSEVEAARLSLRVAISELRKTLGEQALRAERATLQLAPDFPFWVDALEFQAGASSDCAPEDWLAAVDIYTGEFMPDVYNDWALEWRSYLGQAYIETALRLAEHQRSRAAYPQAIELAQRVLRSEPANESAHRLIMLSYEALGERTAALKQYQACVESLQALLGVGPAAETRSIFQRLQSDASHTGAGLTAQLTNLPAALTSFIGRESEIEAVESLLVPLKRGEQAARLVTMTGAGGSGKTRLSIQAATELVDAYPDGVWWIELATFTRPGDVARRVAQVCGVTDIPTEPIEETLQTALRAKQVLLVLDNCEHLVVACEKLARRILGTCPQVQILATSREALGIPGEQIYPVPTLQLPEDDEIDLETAARCEAVTLFVERARTLLPSFKLDAANLASVLSICRRLDGIPLAIELAASRLKTLNPGQIAERLDDRFQLLEMEDGSVLPRQQTLRALIDWSYDLLPQDECALLRLLSVFRGGWTLEAVETICEDSLGDVLTLLALLVDKSLILAQPADQTRFTMLETIREYAREKLIRADEAERARGRHFAYYLEYAELLEPKLWGREQAFGVGALEREHDNLRAAAGWVLTHGAPELQGRLGAALGRFWQSHHHIHEGADYLMAVLPALADESVLLRARCNYWAGEFLWRKGDEAQGLVLLRTAHALYQSIQDLSGMADVAYRIASTGTQRGDLDEANQYFTEALDFSRQSGNTHTLIAAVNGLGEVARQRGDFAIALSYYEETRRLGEQSGNILLVGGALLNMGLISVPLGDYVVARDYLLRASTVFGDIGEKTGQPYILEGLASIEAAEDRPERAASLYAAMESLCLATQVALYDNDQTRHQQAVEALRQQMPAARFASAWQAGLRLTLSQALQLAQKTGS